MLKKVGPSLEVVLDILMNDTVKNIWNIHGLIRGDIEPDRYILFGSHRLFFLFIFFSFSFTIFLIEMLGQWEQ
jgi:hypothetical protein